MRTGAVDAIATVFLLAPFRCRKCQTRFFRLRNSWARFAWLVGAGAACILAVTGFRWIRQR